MALYSASTTFRSLQENSSFGWIAWTNPANGRLVDGSLCSASLNPGQQTRQLEVWQGLSVPSGAAPALQYITGLEVEIVVQTTSGTEKVDAHARLYEHTVGAITGWKSASVSGGALDTYRFGGDGDLWGIVPTWSMIQNKNFGVQVYYSRDLVGLSAELVEHDGVVFKYYYNRRYSLASQGAGV